MRAAEEAEFDRYTQEISLSLETMAVVNQIMARFDAMDAERAAWAKDFAVEAGQRAEERAAEKALRARERAAREQERAGRRTLDGLQRSPRRRTHSPRPSTSSTTPSAGSRRRSRNSGPVAGSRVTPSEIPARVSTGSAAGT